MPTASPVPPCGPAAATVERVVGAGAAAMVRPDFAVESDDVPQLNVTS
ncbi:hypothetical protein [Streptomyces sp. NPDC059278]